MKRWVWLLGTISSISFAQIANSPAHLKETNYTLINEPFYNGFFPNFKPGFALGTFTENTFVGTDIHATQFWGQINFRTRQHRISADYSGSPDWNQTRIATSNFIRINPKWSIGAELGWTQNPISHNFLDGGLHTQYKNKQIRLVASAILSKSHAQSIVGGCYNGQNFLIGLFAMNEGQSTQAHAYAQIPLIENLDMVFCLSSGNKPFGFSVLHRFQNFHLQIGGNWRSTLETLQLFFQLQYVGQVSGDDNLRAAVSSCDSPNRRITR